MVEYLQGLLLGGLLDAQGRHKDGPGLGDALTGLGVGDVVVGLLEQAEVDGGEDRGDGGGADDHHGTIINLLCCGFYGGY